MWDVVVRPSAPLLPGGDTTGRIALAPGGSAANVAVWIARSGMPAGFVGSVGADVLGDLIVADLEREGVRTSISRSLRRDTGVVLVLVDRDGQRSMVTNQGADFDLQPWLLPLAALETCAHVHITGWSLFTDPPRAAALRSAQVARAAGASVSFDPASHQMIGEMGLGMFLSIAGSLPFDIIFPNRDEGTVLTGEHDPEQAARALRARFPGTMAVLKLDRDGCYVLADNHAAHYPADRSTVIDATGAGDGFDGAFLARYLYDGNIAAAARFANAIGGWVVSRYGARPPADERLRAILASHPMSDVGL